MDEWTYDPERPQDFPDENTARAYGSASFTKPLYYLAKHTRLVAEEFIWPQARETRVYTESRRQWLYKRITWGFSWDFLGVDTHYFPRARDIPQDKHDNYLTIASWWRQIKMPPEEVVERLRAELVLLPAKLRSAKLVLVALVPHPILSWLINL